MSYLVLDKEILSACSLNKLQQMMDQRKISWKNVTIKGKGRKKTKKFGSTKEPYITAILDHQNEIQQSKKKRGNNDKKEKNKKKNTNKKKKKKVYKRNINIIEPPAHPGLFGSGSESDEDNNSEQSKEKENNEENSDDEWLNGRFGDALKNDDFDKDGLDSLQDDVNEFAGRKLLSEKHLKLLRKQSLTREYVESLVKNKDIRLTLDLGIVMAIEELLQKDKSMGNENDSGTNKNKKDTNNPLIKFDGTNLHKLVDYIYNKKYKDVYVVSPKNQCKGGIYVVIGSKTFYGHWENIFLELIFTLKQWLVLRDDELDTKKKKKIKGKDVYGDIIKNLTSYRTRIWHWRAGVVNPTGYTDIMTGDMVAGDDGKGKVGFGEIGSLLSKKMLVETYLEYENDLGSYPFMYDAQFVKDFQIMTGDIWDSVKDISLNELNTEAKIAGVGGKKKKEEEKQ